MAVSKGTSNLFNSLYILHKHFLYVLIDMEMIVRAIKQTILNKSGLLLRFFYITYVAIELQTKRQFFTNYFQYSHPDKSVTYIPIWHCILHANIWATE